MKNGKLDWAIKDPPQNKSFEETSFIYGRYDKPFKKRGKVSRQNYLKRIGKTEEDFK